MLLKEMLQVVDLIFMCTVVLCCYVFLYLPLDFAKIPSRTFNFIRRSVSREASREGSPHVSGYASGKIYVYGTYGDCTSDYRDILPVIIKTPISFPHWNFISWVDFRYLRCHFEPIKYLVQISST